MIERKAAYPLRSQADDFWAQLHKIASRGGPAARKAFLDAIAKLRDGLEVSAIEAALARGDIERVMQLIPFDDLHTALLDMESSLDSVRSRGFDIGIAAAKPHLHAEQLAIHLAGRPDLTLSFRHVSADVVHAIRTNAANRVTNVTDQTKLAIRQLMERQYVDGLHPRQIVKDIQDTIGLRKNQEAAVERYRLALERDEKVTPKRAAQLVDRMRKQLLKQRAELIARTENMQAANDGQRASWRTLVERGLLMASGPLGMEREWVAIVPTDGRTCVICESLDGARAPLDGDYEEADAKGGPPIHPDDRCVEKLVLIKSPAE